MFEKRTEFTDSLFYDVSAWTLPLAFNLDYRELKGRAYSSSILGDKIEEVKMPEPEIIGGMSKYAYILEYTDYYAPKAVNALLEKDYRLRVSTKEITSAEGKSFAPGSILLALGIQEEPSADAVYDDLQLALKGTGVKAHALNTGLTGGVNLGSPSLIPIEKPEVAVLVGAGTRSYDAGEIWHLFDQRYDMKITKLETERLGSANLDRYNTLIMVDGYYRLSDSETAKIKTWVNSGGNLIVYKSAISWAKNAGINNVAFLSSDSEDNEKEYLAYEDLRNNRGTQFIGGAIFNSSVDLTHPLLYGYERDEMPVFRNSTIFLDHGGNAYAHPIRYTSSPLLSGYISKENLDKLGNTPSVAISRSGRGRVINFTDNTNFRAFWFGTNKLLMNAVFFGPTISAASAR